MKNYYIISLFIVAGILMEGFLFFGLSSDGQLNKMENLVNSATADKYLPAFISYGYMAESASIVEHATVGLVIDNFVVNPDEIPKNGDEYYANVVDQCVFHSADSFDPMCVICKLKDSNGNVIGAGIKGETFDQEYIGSTSVKIDIISDPLNINSNAADKIQDVEVSICAPLENEEGQNPIEEGS